MHDTVRAESLRSGVGRRILAMFLLATLLPVIFTAYLSYNEVHRGLQFKLARSLKENAKSYGVDVLDRLTQATEAAWAVAGELQNDNVIPDDHDYMLRMFDAIWRQHGGDVVSNPMGIAGIPIELHRLNLPHLRTRNSQLLIDSSGSHGSLLLVVAASLDQHVDVVVFRLNAGRIWGPKDNLPFMTEFCVFASPETASFCTASFAIDQPTVQALSARSFNDGPLEYSSDGEPFLITSWQLFLDGLFAAPPITVVAGQPESYALKASADFRRIFPPVLALVFVLAAAFSLKLIGSSLRPLNQLKQLARRFAAGELQYRADLRSGDEFQELGETFNFMAGRLGQQIDALKAMSDIDRLILAGAPMEEVGEKVIRGLIEMMNCESAGVIARDSDAPLWAKMISYCGEDFVHERISLPQSVGSQWSDLQHVELENTDPSDAPYLQRFLHNGQTHVVVIPVLLDSDLKGVLLVGAGEPIEMTKSGTQQCIDLAGRLAVALASAEREDVLYRQAHYDELTGLPNRQLLKDRLQQQIVQARRDSRSGALLFLDLDRFKDINDVYGHSTGDQVLFQAAERLVVEVPDTATVARLGGDEFVVVLPSVDDNATIPALAERLLERLSDAFTVREDDHFVGASIGIVTFPEDGNSVETLLKNADAAMYRAKDSGRSRFEFFSEKLNAESRRKIKLERDLRDAFSRRVLEVHYQPQFDLRSGVICGAEALLRWQHPTMGRISPAEFVPIAEDSGIITEIGRWVLEDACETLKSILDRGLHPGPVSINVSALQIRDARFIDDVLKPLDRFGIRPAFIQLEITETAVAQNRDAAAEILNTLREHGVKIAMDDFGTGFSSLSYLQKLPFDTIKIDKSFVDHIGSGDNSEKICTTIVKMAHEMGKKALAEGVETESQASFLRASGCDAAQGYLYSHPLEADKFLSFVEGQSFHTMRRKALEPG